MNTKPLLLRLNCIIKSSSFPRARTLLTRPLQLSPPDPTAPSLPTKTSPAIERDPGIVLGEKGIPVTPSVHLRNPSMEDKTWTETEFRTLSGGIKSEYLKCILPILQLIQAPNWMNMGM